MTNENNSIITFLVTLLTQLKFSPRVEEKTVNKISSTGTIETKTTYHIFNSGKGKQFKYHITISVEEELDRVEIEINKVAEEEVVKVVGEYMEYLAFEKFELFVLDNSLLMRFMDDLIANSTERLIGSFM